MDLPRQSIRSADRPVRAWLTPRRVVAYSAVALACYAPFLAIWASIVRHAPAIALSRPGADYAVFWSASYVMLHGSPWQAYDVPTFSRLATELFPQLRHADLIAWLYPPTNLLLVTPLALLPYAVGYPLFVAFGVVVFGFAASRVSGLGAIPGASRIGGFALVAAPFVFVTGMFGQNAFLTASCAALAVCWADRRPMWAGLCIGLLSAKPQMALLFPFVLVASRAWRTIAWAALATTAFVASSVLICGVESLRLFVAGTAFARSRLLEQSVVLWRTSPAPFAAFRLAGLSPSIAYAAQACIAALAIAVACIVWTRSRDIRLRAAVLAVATLAANPYVWHYELAWLGIAIACMLATGWQDGWRRGEQTAITLMWLLPAVEYLNPWLQWPQIGPVVTLFALVVLLRRAGPGAQNASRGGT
ncbi:glycosyltransferase family 87 protein [Burkholderia lata]|uniref:Membrane protein n=1 Tax=Burkholderia lata (strain ATCC 17760 / DSM 23089 / LMG 22485 / NCIMB 9086 / R18194 / 383) TaxID=482957 RepID=A0A6P2TKL8_BURL3|nr:glycosyltransferase family 87 protein [Burkholderia lata]VWC56411.1 membrane protein [Burkholderia lata]